MNKIILLDNGYFMFKTIYANRFNKQLSHKWQYLNIMVGCLKKLELTPDDLIIIAIDSKMSWRKKVVPEYKANRKDIREKQTDIDWDSVFYQFDCFFKVIDKGTPFHTIKIDTLEADDIMAIGAKYYKDNEVILVTHDSDMEMLSYYKNVKIFSPNAQRFKEVKNPYRILEKKIRKEVSDNLTSEIKTEEDYRKRKLVVDLINLPKEVETKVVSRLKGLDLDKEYNVANLRINNAGKRILEIYNNHAPIKKIPVKKQKKLF